MKSLIFLVSILLTFSLNQATNSNSTETKTKRGLIGQTFYYGDPHAIRYTHVQQTPVYHDLTSSAATHPSNNQRPLQIIPTPNNHQIKPENELVTAKQLVLYEYQQAPSNIVANIPVTQQYQTTATEPKPEIIPSHFVNQPQILNVEPNQYHHGVITPVQHGAVIHHGPGQGQRYTKLFYTPYNIQASTTPQSNPQGKYVKLYQPIPNNGNVQTSINNNGYPSPAVRNPQNYLSNLNYLLKPTQKPFKPSPLLPFTYDNRIQNQLTTTTTKPTSPAPVKEAEEDEEEEEKGDIREEQEEEEQDAEDHSNYEEDDEDDFRPRHYSRYRYDDDDDDHDHEHYREDEDEDKEDNTRSDTRYVRKNPKKSKPKYYKYDHYKMRKDHEKNKKYSSSYRIPDSDYVSKKPKNQFKSYKYYKSSSKRSPKKESLEGHQSQNIPIVHNTKIVRQEKWSITKKNRE